MPSSNSKSSSDHDRQEEHEPVEHEPVEDGQQEDKASMTSSAAADEAALKEEPGADLRGIPSEHHGRGVMIFYIMCAVVSFALMLTASCPVSWINSSTDDSITLWKSNGVEWKHNPCDHKKQLFRMMAAFSIITCVLSLVQIIVGALQLVGVGHLGVTYAVGFLVMYMSIIPWALCIHVYHRKMCPNQAVYLDGFRLNRGFSLCLSASGCEMLSFVALTYWFYTYFGREEATKESYSAGAFSAAMLFGVTLICAVCGSVYTMWEAYSLDTTVKMTMWHLQIRYNYNALSEYRSIKSLGCGNFEKMVNAGRAFSIISDAFVYLALVCAVGAVYKKFMKWAAVGLGAASAIFLLICWAIMVGIRYKKDCNGTVNWEGYVITDGLALIISAWCISIAATVLMAVKG